MSEEFAVLYGKSLGKELGFIFSCGKARIINEDETFNPPIPATHESLLTDRQRNIIHKCWLDNA